jgi:Ca2+-binding RTX toxin-like protein
VSHVHRSSWSVVVGAALLTSALLPPSTAAAAAPTCFGQPATHVMTAGEAYETREGVVDVVVGTAGPDTIYNPYVASDVGDYLCGRGGDDHIHGGAGPDRINGGDGDDRVYGWRGADVVQGNAGHDIVDDSSQDDQDVADDVLRGGPGNDRIATGWGEDQAQGDGGNDTLSDIECDGPTVLRGGPGDDVFESYQGSYLGELLCGSVADQIHGDDGADRAVADRLDAVTTVETVTRAT